MLTNVRQRLMLTALRSLTLRMVTGKLDDPDSPLLPTDLRKLPFVWTVQR